MVVAFFPSVSPSRDFCLLRDQREAAAAEFGAEAGALTAPEGGAAVAAVPAVVAAAGAAVGACGRSFGINGVGGDVGKEIVEAPFPDVAVHVVCSDGAGRFQADFLH